MRIIFIFIFIFVQQIAFASYLLIPMDESQKNHLKAYGIAFWALQNDTEVSWLLNYRGGSFITSYHREIEEECMIRGVSYHIVADFQAQKIFNEIARPDMNMDRVKLEKAPKIAVYSPKSKLPWDDAVTLVLTYAEIPYDIIYDKEIMEGDLSKYDWLHLHHEDFTGQYGKFYGNYRNIAWYQNNKREMETLAAELGFAKVSELKKYVVQTIRDYVIRGGFLFAMCSATDTYDIALALGDADVCGPMFDGDPYDANVQSKLDFTKTFAFKDFKLSLNPFEYEFSNIDVTSYRKVPKNKDYFSLFEFSAKWDPVPTMLCQNHETLIRGFMGQTTSFNKDLIKSNVLILGEYKAANEARYIHGEYGKGTWTFYGGHDPADYQHFVGDPKTNLDLHPNSPGYRLILNNILFPAAKKKKMKT
ncbi:MAG: asparagine synthetase B [Bacteroidetes bacterium]|nr:MAG: asparagine synthetase B [Bacteroidota bacterium]